MTKRQKITFNYIMIQNTLTCVCI